MNFRSSATQVQPVLQVKQEQGTSGESATSGTAGTSGADFYSGTAGTSGDATTEQQVTFRIK